MKRLLLRFWPIGILLVIWAAFAFPYWGKGNVPFPGTYLVTFFSPWSTTHGMPVKNNAMPDVITQIYPWKRVTIQGWKSGELPLWNPYSFSGTSHIGTYQSAIFSPVNALFLLLPEIHAWSVMILLQPLLAGIGMYLFLRRLGRSPAGSAIGSVAFMFCGFLVVWMAYGTLGYAVLVLPFILYGIHVLIRHGDARGGIVAALGLFMSFVSGHFQMSLYVLLYSAAFLLYQHRVFRNGSRTAFAVLYVGLGLMMAAPQLMAGFDAYGKAVRSSIFVKGEVIPWQYLVTILSPDFFGNPVTRNDWFGHYAEWASYIGVAPLLLALLSLSEFKKESLVRFFGFMAAVSLLLAFQTPFVDLLYALKVPVLSTSAASRIIVLASFSLAALAAFGFDRLVILWEKRRIKTLYWWLGLSAVIAIFVWAVLMVVRPLEADKISVAVRNSVLPTLFLISTAGVAVAGFIIPKRYRVVLIAAFILITAFDVYRFAAKWMPFDPSAYVYPPTPVITKLAALTAGDKARIIGNLGNEVGSAFGLSLIEGYDAVYQYRYGKFISSVTSGLVSKTERSVVQFDKHGKYAEDVAQLLGARYYAHKKSDGRFPWAYPYWEFPHYRIVWSDDQYEIWENTKAFPRAFAASSFTLAQSDEEILGSMYAGGFDRRDSLVLERTPDILPATGAASVRIVRYRPTEVAISVDATAPKLIFLSDVYDEGWQVLVDGRDARLLRADFAFRAVAVAKGKHTILMRYRPVSTRVGLVVSGFATLGVFVLILWKKRV